MLDHVGYTEHQVIVQKQIYSLESQQRVSYM